MQGWNTLGIEGWIVQVFLTVFAALLTDFFQKRILVRLARQAQKSANPWDDAVIEALGRPLSLLIWLLGITFAADIIRLETGTALFGVVEPIRAVGVVVLLAWGLIRFIRQGEANFVAHRQERGRPPDRTTVDAVSKLLRISVWITATLVALQTLGFSVSGVLAFGGIGGLAVGLAAQDLLANFFGGLVIYLDRPFAVGDWIRSPDKEIEGTVEHVGWRVTRIRTFDKRPLYVPNAIFTKIAVENPSRMSHRRIKETIGIRYADVAQMEGITAKVEAMLRGHPDIDDAQTLMVHFNAFAPSSLDFFIYTFTKTTVWTEYHRIKQDVLLKIAAIIEEHGAQIAFPTSTVHVVAEEPG